MFTFKAGELLNKSNYRLSADDIIVDIMAAVFLLKSSPLIVYIRLCSAIFITHLIRASLLVSIDFTIQVVISNLSE